MISVHNAVEIYLRPSQVAVAVWQNGNRSSDTCRTGCDRNSENLGQSRKRFEAHSLDTAEDVKIIANTLTDNSIEASDASVPPKRYWNSTPP